MAGPCTAKYSQVQPGTVLKRPIMCYIFEKQALRRYQIWYWEVTSRTTWGPQVTDHQESEQCVFFLLHPSLICILSILYCISMKFLQFTEASRRDCWGSPLYPTSKAYCTEFQWKGAALRERKIYHNLGYCLSMLFLRKDNGWFITQTKPIYYCWTTFWLKKPF